jgi:hypothetical protein
MAPKYPGTATALCLSQDFWRSSPSKGYGSLIQCALAPESAGLALGNEAHKELTINSQKQLVVMVS